MIIVWSLVVSLLLGYCISYDDPVLVHMCSLVIGPKFWRDFLECTNVLKNSKTSEEKIYSVLSTCLPFSNPAEAEKTRCSICTNPDLWVKKMDCVNSHLIELQNESNPNLELSPGYQFRTCVTVLVDEAYRSLYDEVPFLPEDDREIDSNCTYKT